MAVISHALEAKFEGNAYGQGTDHHRVVPQELPEQPQSLLAAHDQTMRDATKAGDDGRHIANHDGADQHVYQRLIGEKRGQGLADLLEPLAGAWHGCTRCGER